MNIIWEEIQTNDNEPLITPDSRYRIRTFIAEFNDGYLFKQMMGITCLGITYINNGVRA